MKTSCLQRVADNRVHNGMEGTELDTLRGPRIVFQRRRHVGSDEQRRTPLRTFRKGQSGAFPSRCNRCVFSLTWQFKKTLHLGPDQAARASRNAKYVSRLKLLLGRVAGGFQASLPPAEKVRTLVGHFGSLPSMDRHYN